MIHFACDLSILSSVTVNHRYGKGTDYHAFNLAANTWQLHYLRLTNQLNEDGKYRYIAKDVFYQMNVEYTAVMRRFSSHGSFKNWDMGRTLGATFILRRATLRWLFPVGLCE